MTSAILLNAIGATAITGGLTAALVHTYRSLAADERRSLIRPAGARAARIAPAGEPVPADHHATRSADRGQVLVGAAGSAQR